MLTSRVHPTQLDNILVFRPVAVVTIIGDQESWNDIDMSSKLGNRVEQDLETILPAGRNYIKVSLDDKLLQRVDLQIWDLKTYMIRVREIDHVPVPPLLDSLMTVYNADYALTLSAGGYLRTKESRAEERSMKVGTALYSLGRMKYVSYKSLSGIYCFILDHRRQNVAFYNDSQKLNIDPNDQAIIDTQMHDIFKDYFTNK